MAAVCARFCGLKWPGFAVAPAEAADFHDEPRSDLDLDTVFCLECERVVSNDGVIRYNNRLLQLEPGQVSAGGKVQVQERRTEVCAWCMAARLFSGAGLKRFPSASRKARKENEERLRPHRRAILGNGFR